MRKNLVPLKTKGIRIWLNGALGANMTGISTGTFSRRLVEALPKWQGEYSENFKLLQSENLSEIRFVTKPFKSIVDKIYRLNIVEEADPKLPIADSLGKFDDLIRTTIICRFGDGPEFLANKFSELAGQLGIRSTIKKRADDYGYYAIHFLFETPVDILRFGTSDIITIQLKAEIQITTQLQASLRDLTHTLYEVRRLAPKANDDWKWDFASPYFRPSYTGHTLHLLESLLVEIKKSGETNE